MALSTSWPSSDREWYKDTKPALTWRAACGPATPGRQVSGAFKSLVTLVGFAFVLFVPCSENVVT